MILYYRTTSDFARSIRERGFQGGDESHLADGTHHGVWLSDRPLDASDGAFGDKLLQVKLGIGDAALEAFEQSEAGKDYREFLVPADVVNAHAEIIVIDE